jgi:hypothetical protein
MTINLSQEDLEAVILNSLCNGALSELAGYGLEVNFDETNYDTHKVKGNCYEDNLLLCLKNGEKLVFDDNEADEQVSFTMAVAKERLEKHGDEYIENIKNVINGDDDATDGDIILQLCLYDDVIYG